MFPLRVWRVKTVRGEWGARGLRSGGKSGSSGPNVYRITPGAVNLIPPCPEAATLAPLPPPFSDTPSVLLLLDFGLGQPAPNQSRRARHSQGSLYQRSPFTVCQAVTLHRRHCRLRPSLPRGGHTRPPTTLLWRRGCSGWRGLEGLVWRRGGGGGGGRRRRGFRAKAKPLSRVSKKIKAEVSTCNADGV